MKQSQRKIEDLLEGIGSHEVPGDSEHRYELRRRLLCSSYFENDCEAKPKRDRVFTFTIPLFAGSIMVIIFASFGNSLTTGPTQKTVDFKTVAVQPTFELVEESSKDHLAQFVQYDNVVPLEQVVRFVPVEQAAYSRVR